MAREVEIKIQMDTEQSKMLKKWLKKNAEFEKEVAHQEFYLDNPKSTFFFTHKSGFKDAENYFRVRMEKNGSSVCLKVFEIDQDNDTSRNLDEVEFSVSDGKEALKLFKMLGFTQITEVSKSRKVYRYDDFEIVLDSVKELGDFAEFEYTGKRLKTYEQELHRLYTLLKNIGFKEIRMQSRGYVSMLWNMQHDFSKLKKL